MDLELGSGVKVSIQENGNAKFLFFDRPVKAMELTMEESNRLAASLTRRPNVGITNGLRNLIASGFFFESKTFKDIKKELALKGVGIRSTSLNKILTKMVERGDLVRAGQKGAYQYKKNSMGEQPRA